MAVAKDLKRTIPRPSEEETEGRGTVHFKSMATAVSKIRMSKLSSFASKNSAHFVTSVKPDVEKASHSFFTFTAAGSLVISGAEEVFPCVTATHNPHELEKRGHLH
mmetsp:Transcript_23633/g.58743  ORF Transcript_23633/g.58743 Transcript_23633/m.58743 type:complete len:106 (-) Transcript_23633:202-519(-)